MSDSFLQIEEGMRQTNKINKIKQTQIPMPFQVYKIGMQNTMSLKVTQIFHFCMKILHSL